MIWHLNKKRHARPELNDLIDLIGDIVGLRIVTQRLFTLFALATGKDDAWLEQQRSELLYVLTRSNITSDTSEQKIKARAETCINSLFDEVRIVDGHPPTGRDSRT